METCVEFTVRLLSETLGIEFLDLGDEWEAVVLVGLLVVFGSPATAMNRGLSW